jgi:GT2 family glycosyltransferase
MNFAIGIPTINRYDLLKPSLLSYLQDFKGVDIIVIDNGKQGIYYDYPKLKEFTNLRVVEPDYNLGVASSWNLLCKMIYDKYENALILNDDVYLGYGTDVVDTAISKSQVGLVQSDFNWSVFIINKFLYDHVGEFDEDFYPAYFEDSDYIYRMKLLGLRHEVDKTLSPLVKRTASSINPDRKTYENFFQRNRSRYIKKWGNSPLLETHTTAFNKSF